MKPYFAIVGSKILRQNSKYHVSVSNFGYDVPQKFEVSIQGEEKSFQGQQKLVTLSGNSTSVLEYDIVDQPEGNYFLEVKAVDGEKFERKVNLNLNMKKFSVFVQTDKSIYKPSEKIQFRVLLLDIDTKPYHLSNVQIFVTDGAQNRVKQFLNPNFKKGVFEGELQLSDSPVMGGWTIHVKTENNEERKDFEVAEYVLPKFEVIVDANPHVVFSDGKIHAMISGKYTFGKLAKGKATVTAKFTKLFCGWCVKRREQQKVEKIVDVDGKKDVEFDFTGEFGISEVDSDQTVEIEATFVEELSGKEHKGSASVTIHKSAHKIDVVKSNEKIKPGLPFWVNAIVKTHDGAPVMSDKKNPVEFVVTYYRPSKDKKQKQSVAYGRGFNGGYNEESERKFEKILLSNGTAKLSIVVSINVTRIEIDVTYAKTTERTHSIQKYESQSGQYLQVNVLTKNPKIGDEVSAEVLTTEKIKNLTYTIHGRSDVIMSKSLGGSNSKSFKLSFKSTKTMMPKAKLLVYYIREDGEIISDHVKIDFGFKLENTININLSADQAKPGEVLNLTVNSDPNSFVGLLGVDQSVLLLKSGNDIEKSSVSSELEKYNFANHYNSYYGAGTHRYNYQDFEKSNVALITNAKEEFQPSMPMLMYKAMVKGGCRGGC